MCKNVKYLKNPITCYYKSKINSHSYFQKSNTNGDKLATTHISFLFTNSKE